MSFDESKNDTGPQSTPLAVEADRPPLVSVVITAYNLGWCIADTLQNVFEQTYPNIEVIVVDDASTDDTPQRVAPFLSRIRYLRHASNQGVARGAEAGPARNTGIRAARGELIAILDGDDLWHPEKIASQVSAAQRFPEAGMIVTDGVAFAHENGDVIRSTLLFDYDREHFFGKLPNNAVVQVNLYKRTMNGCPFDTPSQVMFRRGVFAAVGEFAEVPSDDYEFVLRASEHFDAAVVKRCLVRYRVHGASLSGGLNDQFYRFTLNNIRILKGHASGRGRAVQKTVREQIRRRLALAAVRATDRGRAGQRTWALGFLGRLAAENWRSAAAPYVLLRAAFMLIPNRVARFAEPFMRRLHRLLLSTSSSTALVVGADAMPF